MQKRLSAISNLDQMLMNQNKGILIYKVRSMPPWSQIQNPDYIFDLTAENTSIPLMNNEKILLFLQKDLDNLNPCAYIPLTIIVTSADYISNQHQKKIVSYESKLLGPSSFVDLKAIESIKPKKHY